MADKKISALTELVAADIASDDELVIVDTSTGVTKKTSVGSLIDNSVPQSSGTAGSVAVISDVQSSILYNKLGGKIFDKNVLLRDGDEQTLVANAGAYAGGDSIQSTDVLLQRTSISALAASNLDPGYQDVTAKFYNAGANLASLGVHYTWLTYYASYDGTSGNLIVFSNGPGGDTTFESSVFNLTSLGTLTADHVTMMNNMALVNGWTLAGSGTGGAVTVADTWALIGTWLNSATERAEFFAIAIPSHVSSMEGAIVEEGC
jgi:hypothetical protein